MGKGRHTGVIKGDSRGVGRQEGRDLRNTSVGLYFPCLCGQSMRLTHGRLEFSKSKAEFILLLPTLPPLLFSL